MVYSSILRLSRARENLDLQFVEMSSTLDVRRQQKESEKTCRKRRDEECNDKV